MGSTCSNQREGSAFSGDAFRDAFKEHVSAVFNESQTDIGKFKKTPGENNYSKNVQNLNSNSQPNPSSSCWATSSWQQKKKKKKE